MTTGSGIVGVVLGGGRGARMEPITPYVDKVLVRILGKPLIYYPLNSLLNLGLGKVYLISRNPTTLSSELAQYVEHRDVEYVTQGGEGLEDALSLIYEVVAHGTVMVTFGDVLMPPDAYRLALDSHMSSGASVTMLTTPMPDLQDYIEVGVEGDHITVAEATQHKAGYALAGVLVAEGEFLRALHEHGGDLNSVLGEFRGRVNLAVWSGWFIDITYPWDLLNAVRHLLSGLRESRISGSARISPRAVVEGPIVVDDGAEVDHGAIIKGPVYIGRDSYVGNNALVRNNTSIEEGAVVGADAEVTESLIEPRATVGRGSFVGDSVIGHEAVIEPGVVTLSVLPSGVEVSHVTPVVVKGKVVSKLGLIAGPRCRIGANSVIYPGTVVEPNRYVPPLSILKPHA